MSYFNYLYARVPNVYMTLSFNRFTYVKKYIKITESMGYS